MLRKYITRILYPLGECFGGRTILKKLYALRREAALPFEERKKQAASRLYQQVVEASRKIPYYRDLFSKKHFHPEWLKDSPEALEELPWLTKDIIREQGRRMLHEDYANGFLHERKTGGSTGPSTMIYYSQEDLDWTAAQNILMLEWAGKKLGEKEVHLSTRFLEPPTPEGIRYEKRKCFLLNRVNILTKDHSEKEMEDFLRRLQKARAVSVQGHASTMYALANYMESKNIISKRLFDIFISTGESILDSRKQKIERFIGCKVADRYGAAEFGVMAQQLRQSNDLLVSDSLVWPEVTDCDQEGVGELVFTAIRNKAMPLIRYRMGDLGRLDERDTGWWASHLSGRIHDEVSIGGHVYPTHYLLDVLDHRCPGILDFQVLARKGVAEGLNIVPGEGQDITWIAQHLQKEFPGLPVRQIQPDELRFVGRRGKFRYIFSLGEE